MPAAAAADAAAAAAAAAHAGVARFAFGFAVAVAVVCFIVLNFLRRDSVMWLPLMLVLYCQYF